MKGVHPWIGVLLFIGVSSLKWDPPAQAAHGNKIIIKLQMNGPSLKLLMHLKFRLTHAQLALKKLPGIVSMNK